MEQYLRMDSELIQGAAMSGQNSRSPKGVLRYSPEFQVDAVLVRLAMLLGFFLFSSTNMTRTLKDVMDIMMLYHI